MTYPTTVTTPDIISNGDEVWGEAHALNEVFGLRKAVEDWKRQYSQMTRSYQDFQDTVRDHIIEYAEGAGHCKPGTNRHLEALGLDPWTQSFTVELTVTTTITVEVEEAIDDGDAADQAIDMFTNCPDDFISRWCEWETELHSTQES